MIEIDWNAPRTGCKTPGCGHPTFHVCLFGQDLDTPVVSNKSHPSPYKGRKLGSPSSLAISNMETAQQDRWDRIRFQNRHRDQKIVARYAEGGVSMKNLQDEFGLSRNGIRTILRRAEKAGEIKIRPRGVTVAYDKGSRSTS